MLFVRIPRRTGPRKIRGNFGGCLTHVESAPRGANGAGLRNFFHVYRELASTWRFYDNSLKIGPRLIAQGRRGGRVSVRERATWERINLEWA